PSEDAFAIRDAVEVEPEGRTEAIPQGRGEEPGPGRRTDQAERPQGQLDRACGGTLSHHQIELEILHGRIERLLDDRVQAWDLVDKPNLPPPHVRQTPPPIPRP